MPWWEAQSLERSRTEWGRKGPTLGVPRSKLSTKRCLWHCAAENGLHIHQALVTFDPSGQQICRDGGGAQGDPEQSNFRSEDEEICEDWGKDLVPP